MKTMNRIGIAILTVAFFVCTAAQCQFFWSHNGGTTTTVAGCVEYGYLYNWYAATDDREIASEGWHVPNNTEIQALMSEIEPGYNNLSNTIGEKIKEEGTTYWGTTGGTNVYGFNARGSGHRTIDGTFSALQDQWFMLSATERDSVSCWNFRCYSSSTTASLVAATTEKTLGKSIRLVKDTTDYTEGEVYTGNDGKTYLTVKIGNQVWLSENLAETQYRNGDPIPTVENATTWAGLTTGAKAAYENDYSNVGCGEAALATVTTDTVSNISGTYAVGGGSITSTSTVIASGLCWNTSGSPTIFDNKTTDGSGTGSFTSAMTGLICARTYHVRAYATNEAGTSYGNEVTFFTKEDLQSYEDIYYLYSVTDTAGVRRTGSTLEEASTMCDIYFSDAYQTAGYSSFRLDIYAVGGTSYYSTSSCINYKTGYFIKYTDRSTGIADVIQLQDGVVQSITACPAP